MAARSICTASGMTSLPMPSPGIIAMRLVFRSAAVEAFTRSVCAKVRWPEARMADASWQLLFVAIQLERTLGLGYRDQRRIELHEGLVYGAIRRRSEERRVGKECR